MNFRKGDQVSICGVVKHDQDGDEENIFVDIVGSYETLWMKPENVKLVQAKFECGDRVIWGDSDCQGEIVSINDGYAWIIMHAGIYCTRHVGTIDRMPELPEVADDAA